MTFTADTLCHRCDCTVGWTGQLCADRTTPCDSPLTNLCAPGSVCSPQSEGGYECRCPLGKAGTNCDQGKHLPPLSPFHGEKLVWINSSCASPQPL